MMKPLTVQRLEMPSENGGHEKTDRGSPEKSPKMKIITGDHREDFVSSLKDELEKVTLGRHGQMDNISRLEERLNGSLKIICE